MEWSDFLTPHVCYRILLSDYGVRASIRHDIRAHTRDIYSIFQKLKTKEIEKNDH